MDVTLLCHCCLRSAPDRAMTTPYSHLGKTETYADLLRDCFDINLVPVESGSSGICWACVGRLRDASDFKLQVQHSQAELQKASLHSEYDVKSEPADDSDSAAEADGAAIDVLKEEPVEKSEIVGEEETSQLLHEQPVEESEIVDEEETSQELHEQPVEESEIVDEEETSQELHEQPVEELEIVDEEETSQELHEQPFEESEIVDEEETSQELHEQPVEELEIVDEEETSQELHEQPFEESEIVDEEETSQELPEDPAIKLDSWDDVTSDAGSSTADVLHPATSVSSRARKQLAMACSVRLERLPDDQPESIHSKEKTYSCEECSKIFGSKSDLRKHIADSHASCKTVMSVQERYACVFCSSSFQTKLLMLDHEKSEHGVTKFNHLMIHQCTNCNYACNSMSALKKHLIVHGEKSFRCNHCKYACRFASRLQMHMRKHSSEKPFRCTHCKYSCNFASSLKRHIRKHTSEKATSEKATSVKATSEKPIQYRLLPKHL